MLTAMRVSVAVVLVLAVSGCATRPSPPAYSNVVNRFYRDMEICFDRAWPEAVRTSTFNRYNPKVRVQPMRETVTYTFAGKTDRQFRVVLTETPPDTTTVRTFADGQSITTSEVLAETKPVVDRCAETPF
jgi:hypothetical protein